jgi:hypothetical protein
MHLQTHILSGWCVGNCLPLSGRQRLFCMIAASVADIDGISRLAGQKAYWDYHHTLGHNLPVAMVIAVALAAPALFEASAHRMARGALLLLLYLGLFHLHLVMDYYGSGPGWPIVYFWPFSKFKFVNYDTWEFYSWQNISAAAALIACTILIVYWRRRTPLEVLMPNLDRQLVALMRREKLMAESSAPSSAASPPGFEPIVPTPSEHRPGD